MGKVNLEAYKGWLRLRWRYEGQRYCLSLGLEESKSNRVKAQLTILQIEADIETGAFDPSLGRYRPKPYASKSISCSKLFEQWVSNDKIGLSERTLVWHRDSINKLIKLYGDIDARNIKDVEVKRFFMTLNRLSKTTQRRRVETLRACWDWGVSEGLVSNNPWTKLPKVKPEKPNPQPFNKEEINKILITIQQKYPDLLPLIKFMLGTGCRIGEALGLQACDISRDFKRVTIARQLTRGEIKLPKCNQKREIYISENTANLLKELKPATDFMFHDGSWTDDFILNRWRRVLKEADIPYRSPYSCRHTFISHCLEMGMNPVKIAKITGHDVKTLLTHYAGLIEKPVIPDIF